MNLKQRADFELKQNEHKGKWDDWKPTDEELIKEIQYHFMKFQEATETDKKKEFLADIFNYTRKRGVIDCVAVNSNFVEAIYTLDETKNFQLVANICLEYYQEL